MPLLKLDVHAVRNIQRASLLPSPRINFIYGENASGKSALLEAIFILGRARSFRTAVAKSVINFNADHLIVSAQASDSAAPMLHLGVRLDAKTFVARLNQQTLNNRSSLAYALPLQLIYPKSFELLDAGPQYRREFLDWGVFHHDEAFLTAWRNFRRALKHRNALLKTRQSSHIHVWNQELVAYGTIVQTCRKRYLEKLAPVFARLFYQFLALEGIELNLLDGWDDTADFLQVLNHDLEKDLRYGFTHCGPHRADLQILLQGKMARDVLSRGQLKLLVISLKLAQVGLLAKALAHPACVLIDDFAAELDANNRAKLLQCLFDMNCQVFVTATQLSEFGDISYIKDYKMFHVEHGTIHPVECST